MLVIYDDKLMNDIDKNLFDLYVTPSTKIKIKFSKRDLILIFKDDSVLSIIYNAYKNTADIYDSFTEFRESMGEEWDLYKDNSNLDLGNIVKQRYPQVKEVWVSELLTHWDIC